MILIFPYIVNFLSHENEKICEKNLYTIPKSKNYGVQFRISARRIVPYFNSSCGTVAAIFA